MTLLITMVLFPIAMLAIVCWANWMCGYDGYYPKWLDR